MSNPQIFNFFRDLMAATAADDRADTSPASDFITKASAAQTYHGECLAAGESVSMASAVEHVTNRRSA